MKWYRVSRVGVSACAILFFLLLSATYAPAEVTTELVITDRSSPSNPVGTSIYSYDQGDGGECSRAFKVIGKLFVRIKAPVDAESIDAKLKASEPELLKAGANGVIATDFTINKFANNGYLDAATVVFSIIRFTGEPLLDLRTEADFLSILKSKGKLAPIEGVWVDQATKQRVAFLEDSAQKGRYIGVQFDNGNQKEVPCGLIVAELHMQNDGWLIGNVTFDDYARHPARLRMPTGDEFKFQIKKCMNGLFARSYPDKVAPEYRMNNVTYVRQGAK